MSDWDSPADSEFFVIKDHVGALCIFAVNEFLPQFRTKMGQSDTIKAEIVVLDGPHAGKRYAEGLLFGRALVPQLKSKLGGKPVLGRLIQDEADAKVGQSAPYKIAKPTEEDGALADAYVKANGPVTTQPTQHAPQQSQGRPDNENWRVGGNQGNGQGNGYPNQGPPPRNDNPWGDNRGGNTYTQVGVGDDQPPY